MKSKWYLIEDGDTILEGEWEEGKVKGEFVEIGIEGFSKKYVTDEDLTGKEFSDIVEDEEHHKVLATFRIIMDENSHKEIKQIEYHEAEIEKDERMIELVKDFTKNKHFKDYE